MDNTLNTKGNVAFIALVLLVVLTLIGISANRTSTLDMLIARNEIPFKQDFYIAEGGTNIEASYIGRGFYPVININTPGDLADNDESTLDVHQPTTDAIISADKHKVLNEEYDYKIRYEGYFAPPKGYSILHFNRYDYGVETKGGESKVRISSRFYKIGPKAD